MTCSWGATVADILIAGRRQLVGLVRSQYVEGLGYSAG
jgi:hypothetical protein